MVTAESESACLDCGSAVSMAETCRIFRRGGQLVAICVPCAQTRDAAAELQVKGSGRQ